MMKPKTRKERLDWLCYRKGTDYVMSMYTLTDREVKQWFERVYPGFKDLPQYVHDHKHPECLICGSEVRITWTCACGENMSIIDEDDPELKERLGEWNSK